MQNVGGDACDERVSVLYKNKIMIVTLATKNMSWFPSFIL